MYNIAVYLNSCYCEKCKAISLKVLTQFTWFKLKGVDFTTACYWAVSMATADKGPTTSSHVKHATSMLSRNNKCNFQHCMLPDRWLPWL